MSAVSGVINYKINVYWLFLTIYFLQRKCDTCIQTPGCHYFTKDSRYSCFEEIWNVTIYEKVPIQRIDVLEICNLHSDTLNLSEVTENFPHVTNITIWQGNVTNLTGSFSLENRIKVLQFKNLSIEELPQDFLDPLKFLEVLNLSGNHLRTLDVKTIHTLNRIPQVYLSGNHWNCSLNLEWVLQLNGSMVKNLEELKCYQQPYPGKPLVPIARFKNNVQTNCPIECECSMPDVVKEYSTPKLEPIIEVNCSDRGLTELPTILPTQTKILMLERNGISNLEPLISNPIYRGVQDLYLDNNFIDSIEELEGVYWFSHFRVLSLSNNKLPQLPTYALDNALQQNPNMPIAVRIYLGNNPWRCDCMFTPGFQEMLRKYETQVRDIDDIRCSYVEGDENSLTLILELSRSSVCRLPNEYSIRVLDLLNGVLATLIVLILGKLAYDYYHFKKTGRLPWIVTKMP